MKIKLTVLCVFIFIALYSCQEKQSLSEVDKETEKNLLYDISISAGGFNQSISPMDSKISMLKAGAATDPKTAVDKLVFGIYDKNDVLIKTINQNATDIDFGKTTIKLAKGNYTMLVLGVRKEVIIDLPTTGSKNITMSSRFDLNPKFGKEVGELREQFAFIQNPFEIKKDSIYKPFDLKYAIGRLELELLEQIPSEVAYILVGVNNFATNRPFRFDQYVNGGSGTVLYQAYETSKLMNIKNQVLKSNVNFYNGVETNYLVDIRLYDKNYVLLGSKSIPQAKFKPNYVTRISGKLFQEIFEHKNTNYSIKINDEFATDTLKYSF